MEIADEGVGLFQSLFDGFELQLCRVEPLFDVVELAGDPVLFGLQEFERDCSGVVRFEELAALVEQLPLPRDEPCAITDVVLSERDDLLKDHLFGLEAEVVAELDVGVVVLDRFDDSGDVEGALVAAFGVALAAEADEVGVDSGATSGVADDQAAAAAAAPDGALQVVVVGAAFLAGVVLGFEDALDFVEDCLVDKHGVLARVSDAAVFDDPGVVGIAEHVVEGRDGDRLRWPLRRRPAEQPFLGHLLQQRPGCPFACGVHLECLSDERGAFVIDADGADLAAVLPDPDGHVADRCSEGCAAVLGFLDQAFVDFVGEVPRIELGDAAHDPVEQHPAWCLVDVLAA